MNYKLTTFFKQILADTITPVSVYLKIRDRFPNSLLLESSDYRGNENSFSYICCNPIASIKIENETVYQNFPDRTTKQSPITKNTNVAQVIEKFSKFFITSKSDFNFVNTGLFGYISYDAVRYFEDISITKKKGSLNIPDIQYTVYQNIIVINHFNNQAYIFAHCYDCESNIAEIESLINIKSFPSYDFTTTDITTSNIDDRQYKELVKSAKKHCLRGDVFQLVLSKRFSQKFKGDEFNVYRALRSVNPSPYLFYFDYGNFKIFGSSPEAQLIIKDKIAEIHPIAGTFKRTGNDEKDADLAKKLSADPKENAEHVMLVDLARNDLSRNGSSVSIDTYKEIQFYSHVIHLVSKVSAKRHVNATSMRIVADTFPAGTLSGAPKHMAMQLIEKYETGNRDFYGGAIGFMDFCGNFNHAIMIRTFLSKNHVLHWQTGAGLVNESDEENELQEVYNKAAALTKALKLAQKIR